MRSQTDYILRKDCVILQNVAFWDPRHNTSHYTVLGCLRIVTLQEHQCYLGSRTSIPLYPPKYLYHEDTIFTTLRQVLLRTLVHKQAHSSWISEETWRVIEARVPIWRSQYRCQWCLCALNLISVVTPERGKMENSNEGGHIGVNPPCIGPPPPIKVLMALYEGVV